MKKPAGQGSGHSRKHTSSRKHARNKPKHNPKGQPATHHQHQKTTVHTVGSHTTKRGLAIADGPACCTSEALAAALRLTGRPVSDADVLTLHEHVRDATDAGASILATLEAACTWGLGGIRPVSFGPWYGDDLAGASLPAGSDHTFLTGTDAPAFACPPGLILGVTLPGAHAVVAGGGHWWSWGTKWPLPAFPAAVVEEAWAVVWP